MMSRKEHLTSIGIETIINIRATINRGLSVALIEAFPETVAVKRPLVSNSVISHPQWISGTSLNLVLCGSNISSTVKEYFTRYQLSMVYLLLQIQSIMVGLILSDAWLKLSSPPLRANKTSKKKKN